MRGRQVGVVVLVVGVLVLGGAGLTTVRAQTGPVAALPKVGIPGEATLQAGEDVLFAALGGPPIAHNPYTGAEEPGINPAPLKVHNSTNAPLVVSVANDESGVTFVGPGGAALQIRQSVSSTAHLDAAEAAQRLSGDIDAATTSLAQTHLAGCTAAVADGSSISCGPSPIRAGDALDIAVSAAAPDEPTRDADLQPLSWLTLTSPAADGSVASVTVADFSHEQLHVHSDGDTVAATVPDGYAATARVRTNELSVKGQRLSADVLGCVALSTTLSCPLAALTPAAALEFEAALQVSSAPTALTLATPGPAVLIALQPDGADVVTGGLTVAATLMNGAETLSGNGVLRPWLDTGDVQLVIAFTRADGSAVYVEGGLRLAAGVWSGAGFLFDSTAARPETTWSSGDPQVVELMDYGHRIQPMFLFIDPAGSTQQPIQLSELGDQRDPAPGSALHRGHEASVPAVGTAGQALMFWAKRSTPFNDEPAAVTFWIDFGDGSPAQPAPPFAQFDSASPFHLNSSDSTPLGHVYAAGLYTIIVYRDDGSGVRMFGASMVRIDPATS